EDGIRDGHVTGVQTVLFRSSAAAAGAMRPRLRLSSRAPLRRSPLASLRARLRTPQGVAEPMVESTKTARKTASEPSRKFCWRKRSEEHTSELQSRGHLVCRL